MSLALLAEVLILPMALLVDVMMHLALVIKILMMTLLAEVEQICHSNYCTRDIIFDILYHDFDVIYVHIYICFEFLMFMLMSIFIMIFF